MSGYPQVDYSAAKSWVYPSSGNHPIRDYQLSICKHALFMNTLVCLPTGLGKTLIAAVVMYNYYRWFPRGKVIFLAPTKPLVTQQINACHGIMGIPEEHIAHLEGSVSTAKRTTLWESKRVFFCTPQTLSNDLAAGRCDARSIVCLVIDEAHRATGQYAYTTVIQEIVAISTQFRVLALSATPGTDVKRVQAVINNLLIAHVELRAEDDPELAPYTHQRQIDVVVCQQGAYNGIQAVRKHINSLMNFALGKLLAHGMVDCSSAQEVNFLHLKEAESAMKTAWTECVFDLDLLRELNAAVEELGSLLRCRKALCDEGMRSLLELLKSIQSYYEEGLRSGQVESTHSVVSTEPFQYTLDLVQRACADPKYLEKRQPKLNQLKDILADHFARHGKAGSSTRALVFTQLRSTVHEIKTEISDVPGVLAHEFVGQGVAKSMSTYNEADPEYSTKGLTQADQARILRAFNDGQYNVLVATSIAEEGLDIAEVDLIVLFEAVASPIRLVQRCGRTGRKRSGKIVMLVAQGAEEQRVEKSHDEASAITKTLRNASKSMHFYAKNPEMIPAHLPSPQMVLREMEIAEFRPGEVAGGLAKLSHSSSSSSSIAQRKASSGASGASGAASSFSSGAASSRSSVGAHQVLANPFLADAPRGREGATNRRSAAASALDVENSDDDWMEARTRVPAITTAASSSSSSHARHAQPAEAHDIFGWGLSESASEPSAPPHQFVPHPADAHLTSLRQGSYQGGAQVAGPRKSIWSSQGSSGRGVECVDLMGLVDTPLAKSKSKRKVHSVQASPVAPQLRSPRVHGSILAPTHPWRGPSGNSSNFQAIRLKNVVKSTSRNVSFHCDFDESSAGATSDGTLEDSADEGHFPGVTILDSDLKPRRRRAGRIAATQAQDSPYAEDSARQAATTPEASSALPSEGGGETECSEEDDGCDAEEWEDTANACCACLGWEADDDDPIVFCDGLCGSCVHVSCYGLLPSGVPEGDFFCESCVAGRVGPHPGSKRAAEVEKPVCALCFQAGGLMKRSTCAKWTHPVCVLFTPELTVCEETNRPDNIASLLPDRGDLICRLCQKIGGASVQCCVKDCLYAYHPYCAYTARQQMVVRVDSATEAVTYELYCSKHKQATESTSAAHGEVASSRIPVRRVIRESTAPMLSQLCVGRKHATKSASGARELELRKLHAGSKRERTHSRSGDPRGTSRTATSSLVLTSAASNNIRKDGRKRGGAAKDVDAKRRRLQASKFFELEAAQSGSDSGDESEDAESDEESCISGGFINDGAYTQHESPGAATQYGMYLAVNNYHHLMQSPDDVVRGRPNVAALVRRRRIRDSPGDSSVASSEASVVEDTPPGPPRAPRHHREDDRGEDTASENTASDSEEAEFDDTDENRRGSIGGRSKKPAVKPGASVPSMGVATHWQRTVAKHAGRSSTQSSEDSEDGEVTTAQAAADKSGRGRTAGIAQSCWTAPVTKVTSMGKADGHLRRPPLVPIQPNIRATSVHGKPGSVADSTGAISWDF